MSSKISGERQASFYAGTGLAALGLVLFVSVLVGHALSFGDFTDFEARTRSGAIRALVGVGLIVVGGFLRGVGQRGIAGSGLVLDPSRARRDLEPFSRMAGGMLKDALDEANVELSGRGEKVVMIKCARCAKLNEAEAKFCQECGQRF
jgi:hypothetical protein